MTIQTFNGSFKKKPTNIYLLFFMEKVSQALYAGVSTTTLQAAIA